MLFDLDDPIIDTFIADIVARPDDIGPRLVFADWLEDHGDAYNASFIRKERAPLLNSKKHEPEEWIRFVRRLVAPLVRKTWGVFPLEFPCYFQPKRSFPSLVGGCNFRRCGGPPFVAAVRYGFVEGFATAW